MNGNLQHHKTIMKNKDIQNLTVKAKSSAVNCLRQTKHLSSTFIVCFFDKYGIRKRQTARLLISLVFDWI